MQCTKWSINWNAASMVVIVILLVTNTWAAAREKVLHSFNFNDGDNPSAGVISDAAGNLYGATVYGGTFNKGAVFQLTLKPGGGWKETVLHSFKADGKDGTLPDGGLVFDSAGDLYGTTTGGGHGANGAVFELIPKAGGGWKEKIVHSFNVNDGLQPFGNLIFDAAGNLYGATLSGGHDNVGTVFELSLKPGGGWKETVLHSFGDLDSDGNYPRAGLVMDAAGNLYGTTSMGGDLTSCDGGCGTVFELTPRVSGEWKETVLHNFNGNDGYLPIDALIFDAVGNLYSTTAGGGVYGHGTVFELTSNAGGRWTEKVLHSFNNDGTDGYLPYASLIFDATGNLYGTTFAGGTYPCLCGTLFELTPKAGEKWKEKVLHSFNGTNGYGPTGGVILDSAGNLYGTTVQGGAGEVGIVFEIRH